METLINERNLKVAHEKGRMGSGRFNCYCTSLFVLGKREELYWIDCPEITEFINNDTAEVTRVKRGDILVMYAEDIYGDYVEQQNEDKLIIVHTAVYMGNGEWFHKEGGGLSSFTDKKGILNSYGYQVSKIRRINN